MTTGECTCPPRRRPQSQAGPHTAAMMRSSGAASTRRRSGSTGGRRCFGRNKRASRRPCCWGTSPLRAAVVGANSAAACRSGNFRKCSTVQTGGEGRPRTFARPAQEGEFAQTDKMAACVPGSTRDTNAKDASKPWRPQRRRGFGGGPARAPHSSILTTIRFVG